MEEALADDQDRTSDFIVQLIVRQGLRGLKTLVRESKTGRV
jgi:hypothetical protein